MKKLLFVLVFALVAAPALLADTVKVGPGGSGAYGPYYDNGIGGGEFTLFPSFAVNNGYFVGTPVSTGTENVTGVTGSFQSFCVQTAELVNPGQTYYVEFSDHSIYHNEPLTLGAAYLYELFATGNLTGYNYAGGNTVGLTGRGGGTVNNGNLTSSYYLQQAIWWFMGVGSYDVSNPFTTLANTNLGLTQTTDLTTLNSGTYGVEVMNLWTDPTVRDSSTAAQDMLVLVPDGGLTVMLLGIGVGILAVIARRLGR